MLIAGEQLAAIHVIQDSKQCPQVVQGHGRSSKYTNTSARTSAKRDGTTTTTTSEGRGDPAAKGSPKTREGTKQRRARGATHTVVRRTGAQKIVENVTYFEHLQKLRFLGPNQGAPNVTHSEEFGT